MTQHNPINGYHGYLRRMLRIRELARFAARTIARTLPPGVVEKGRACLLYGMEVASYACVSINPRRLRAQSPVPAQRATHN
ncbi:MAG: hypothetical protein E6H60_13400 [Betaproteobacteria bacterium]|nr:MAG: hypothetical protein E6H60_13400 [Betaproteobacteria bacterium]TMI06698.1 MAG: hypothetical protein E6H46_04065 [Betaproteobacteria bacterium]